MAVWLQDKLEHFGVKTAAIPLGQQHIEGQVLDLPPAIVGRIGNDPRKKTILVYGHFDVQPVCLVVFSQIVMAYVWFTG